MVTIQRNDLDSLFAALERRGLRIIGPTVRDEAVVLDFIHTSAALPRGRADEQAPGHYRLRERDDDALFGYAVGPLSWKQFLYPPLQTLLRARREGTPKRSGAPGFIIDTDAEAAVEPSLAFFGVRPCDLAAMVRFDSVFLGGPYRDPGYARRRQNSSIVPVNCPRPGGTCFCVSMGTGPKALGGYDIALTEVVQGDRHFFLAEPGTGRGSSALDDVPTTSSTAEEISAADCLLGEASRHMGRSLDTDGLRELFLKNFEHPRWQQTAQRCLACTNCTMVCPTCFCSTMDDTTDLTGSSAERRRRWDSCFTLEYSHIHGGSVRPSGMSRYRQWITHKLSSWVDQFGTFGCTGCGRCITWCPVGIDLTQEAEALRHPLTDPATLHRENTDGRPETHPAQPSVL